MKCRWKDKQHKHLRKERGDLLRQFCNVTLARELGASNESMPDSGMDMNSIATKEQCEQRIQSVLRE